MLVKLSPQFSSKRPYVAIRPHSHSVCQGDADWLSASSRPMRLDPMMIFVSLGLRVLRFRSCLLPLIEAVVDFKPWAYL